MMGHAEDAEVHAWNGGHAGSGSACDVVLVGGRVVDPDSGFDGVANVGIAGGTSRAESST